jgi:hypothetical protein
MKYNPQIRVSKSKKNEGVSKVKPKKANKIIFYFTLYFISKITNGRL